MISKKCLKRLQDMFSPRQYECVFGLATGLDLGAIAQSLDTSTTNASATIAGVAKKLGIETRSDKTVIEQVREWTKDFIDNYHKSELAESELIKETQNLNLCEPAKEIKEQNIEQNCIKLEKGENPMCDYKPSIRQYAKELINLIREEANINYNALGRAVVINSKPSFDIGYNTDALIEKLKRYETAIDVLEEIGK